ncbi:MAG: hypothetical protein KC800_23265, partial [Candidatus Eremiobacteraeota bacterium]|nr:hypothetical protein [Candidatus Eremiobacteraeota bacterium]
EFSYEPPAVNLHIRHLQHRVMGDHLLHIRETAMEERKNRIRKTVHAPPCLPNWDKITETVRGNP